MSRSKAKAWRSHADRLAAERETLFPGSVSMPEGVDTCPLHNERLGHLSRMCWTCWLEAWVWTAEHAPESLPEADK